MSTLLQQLVQKGILEKEKAKLLKTEIKSSNRREEEILLEKKIVPEEVLFRLKSQDLKINLKKMEPETTSLEVLELIPEDSARYYKTVPLRKIGDVLEVGMVYPEDPKAQEAIKFLARQGGFQYRVYLITPSNFNGLLRKYKSLKKEVAIALEELETELRVEEKIKKPKALAEFEKLAEEAPITRVVAAILKQAVDGGASDIHVEPARKELRIRFRIEGILRALIFLPLKIHPAIVARIKILSSLRIDETRIPQDGRFSITVGQKSIDFRVSTFPTTLGEKVVLRVLDPTIGLKKLEELGLEGRNLKVVQAAMKKPYGLILATGPTGCGKTTTLYAILRILNKEGVNLMTLEDPVEYFLEDVNQSQVRPEIGYDFAQGLRHMVRQDPDIIMVGEIRDEETAALAIHASLTGHLVLSTLHTNNALGVIPRLIDMAVQPFLISPTLSCALAQRLVRKLCPFCKKKVKPAKKLRELIVKEINNLPEVIKKERKIPKDFYIWQPVGCKKCNQSGYVGRVGIFEVLSMTPELAKIVLGEVSEAKLETESRRQGRITMIQDGILKVLSGITSLEEVLRVAEEK